MEDEGWREGVFRFGFGLFGRGRMCVFGSRGRCFYGRVFVRIIIVFFILVLLKVLFRGFGVWGDKV